MAYLQTVPRQSKGGMVSARVSRLQQLQDAGAVVPMPGLSTAARPLLARFLEVGPVASGTMGAAPLSFTELQAYADLTGIELLPWEASLLRQLSRAWVGESGRAESHDASPPWAPSQAIDRDNLALRVRDVFGARAKKRGGLQ
jgi:hypothetical protein